MQVPPWQRGWRRNEQTFRGCVVKCVARLWWRCVDDQLQDLMSYPRHLVTSIHGHRRTRDTGTNKTTSSLFYSRTVNRYMSVQRAIIKKSGSKGTAIFGIWGHLQMGDQTQTTCIGSDSLLTARNTGTLLRPIWSPMESEQAHSSHIQSCRVGRTSEGLYPQQL